MTENNKKHANFNYRKPGISSKKRELPAWMKRPAGGSKENFGPNRSMGMIEFNGRVHCTQDFLAVAGYCRDLIEIADKSDKTISIAFDMEWPFNFTTGADKTALIQLCHDINKCYLFQVYTYRLLPVSLIRLLEHDKVTINGVCVRNDIRKLARDFPKNNINLDKILGKCIELGDLCNRVLNLKQSWSLQRLCQHILNKDMNKDKEVRASRWSNQNLTLQQTIYAATDVYASQLIYEKLSALEKGRYQNQVVEPVAQPVNRNQSFGLYLCEKHSNIEAPTVSESPTKSNSPIKSATKSPVKNASESPVSLTTKSPNKRPRSTDSPNSTVSVQSDNSAVIDLSTQNDDVNETEAQNESPAKKIKLIDPDEGSSQEPNDDDDWVHLLDENRVEILSASDQSQPVDLI